MIRGIVVPDRALSAFAVCRGPGNPSLATRPATVLSWRGRQIAPDLGGLARSLPRHDEIEILPGGWRTQIAGAAGIPVWHPDHPLLAGLAIIGGHPRPWIADLDSREVTVFEQVRAAVSLAGPACPLAWSADGLLFLRPAQGGTGPPDLEPRTFEARGPAFVTFDEPVESLLRHAAVRIARLDTATGTAETLTGPLLVRALTPSPSGRFTLIETGVEPAWRLLDGPHVPATQAPRWCGDLLSWHEPDGTTTVLDPDHAARTRPAASGESVPDGDTQHLLPAGTTVLDAATEGGGVTLACRGADGRAGLASINGAGVALAWASDSRLAVRAWLSGATLAAVEHPDAIGCYRLDGGQLRLVAEYALASPAPAALAPSGSGSGRPLLLSIRARKATVPTAARDPVIADAGLDDPVSAMNLDLPLHWPADATSGYLTGQVTCAVERALRVAATRYREEYNGRVVVAGTSFGATLALLALSRFPQLDAAIAISGCYNRTLVPTGFQYEHRLYWQAPDVYQAFSPLLFANQLDRPVLLLHGAEDDNPNTSPSQATDLYKAIVATGGHARLVLFPAEGHTFRYAETISTSRCEQLSWLTQAALEWPATRGSVPAPRRGPAPSPPVCR